MVRPLRIEYPGALYHITSRGNQQDNIFFQDQDRERFKGYLVESVTHYSVLIHAWCLMTNHYHLLVETPLGNLSRFMHKLNSSYTTYINKRHNRMGHLFQGRFKALLVEKDAYLLELSRYIHLNPVRANITKRPEDYRWSSYRLYGGWEKGQEWVYTKDILSYFGGDIKTARKRYCNFVRVKIDDKEYSPLRDVLANLILGKQEFINWVKEKLLKDRAEDPNVPQLRSLKPRPKIDEIIKTVMSEFKCPASKLKKKGGKNNLPREVAIYLARNFSGIPVREIGDYFEVSGQAVSLSYRKVGGLIESNAKLKRQVKNIQHLLFTA